MQKTHQPSYVVVAVGEAADWAKRGQAQAIADAFVDGTPLDSLLPAAVAEHSQDCLRVFEFESAEALSGFWGPLNFAADRVPGEIEAIDITNEVRAAFAAQTKPVEA